MPQVSAQEFHRLPLRVHRFLAGVPLHDVWAVDLPRPRAGITLNEFLQAETNRPHSLSPVVRMLLNIRFFVGRIFGWDQEPNSSSWETFATRLTPADRSSSLAPAGTREGFFRIVYRFQNEQLLELINQTAHAAAVSALVEMENTCATSVPSPRCTWPRLTRFASWLCILHSCVASAPDGIKPLLMS